MIPFSSGRPVERTVLKYGVSERLRTVLQHLRSKEGSGVMAHLPSWHIR